METITDTIICPYCGHKQKATIHIVVDSKENPKIKKKILDGKFFLRTCKNCGDSWLMTHQVMYQDVDKRFCICFSNDPMTELHYQTLYSKSVDDVGKWAPTMRVVSSVNAFREKVRLFDQELDDRYIELIKIRLLHSLVAQGLVKDYDEFVCWVDDEKNFEFSTIGKDSGSLTCGYRIYTDTEDTFKDLFIELAESEMKNVQVDWTWAMGIADLLGLEFNDNTPLT